MAVACGTCGTEIVNPGLRRFCGPRCFPSRIAARQARLSSDLARQRVALGLSAPTASVEEPFLEAQRFIADNWPPRETPWGPPTAGNAREWLAARAASPAYRRMTMAVDFSDAQILASAHE